MAGMEKLHDLFHILPNLAFFSRASQEICGMVGAHDGDPFVSLERSPHLGNAAFCLQQRLGRVIPERDDHLGPDDLQLALEIRPAVHYLIRRGGTVIGRAAFENITDKNLFAFHPDHFDDFRKKLSGPSDERQTLLVFIRAGRLPYKNESRLKVPRSKNDFIPRPGELRTELAFQDLAPEFLSTFAFHSGRSGFDSARPGGDGDMFDPVFFE